MENKKLLISALALIVVVWTTVWATYASQWWIFGGWEEVRAAVEANDYSLVPTELQEKITQEKFDSMITKKAAKDAHRAVVEAAVQANDFNAFQTAVETHKAEKEANRPEGKEGCSKGHNWSELTQEEKTEKLQEKFTKLTEYYAENGELPERKKWKRWMRRGK